MRKRRAKKGGASYKVKHARHAGNRREEVCGSKIRVMREANAGPSR